MGKQRVERVRKFLAFEYDVAVDGGEAETYVMRNLDELNDMPVGAVVLGGFVEILEAADAADGMDASDVEIGVTGTTDLYLDDVEMESEGVVAIDTDAILHVIGETETAPILTVGAGDGLDAMKVRLYLEYVLPLKA